MTIIYDVGMHNGDDTAYYLQKGCKVVAIEADPALCEQARRRFAERLGDGLEILNIGIAKEPGELDFFVHRRSSVLSTFRPPKDAGNAEIWRRIVRYFKAWPFSY